MSAGTQQASSRVKALAVLGVGLAVWAAGSRLAFAEPYVALLMDLEAQVEGIEVGIRTRPYDSGLSVGGGLGFGTWRGHYRLQATRPLGLSAAARLSLQDWPEVRLLGHERHQGVEAGVDWEPTLNDRLSARLFYGLVGRDPHRLERRLLYAWLRHDSRLVYSWPLDVMARTELTYGWAGPDDVAATGWKGTFYALKAALPVQIQHLRIIPRAGYSAGQNGLPGFTFELGRYGDGWLRGWKAKSFSGPIMLGATVEYRRPWLEALQVPVLSQLEAGPFVDVATAASPGVAWDELEWHSSYGVTAAVPLLDMLLGLDLAWNEQGEFGVGFRASGQF